MEPRTRLAWGGGLCLLVLLGFVLTTPANELATHRVLGFVFKLTLTIGALWLAWPDLVKIGKHLPPGLSIMAGICLVAVLIQPRFGALMVLGTIVYWTGWWLYRKVFFIKHNNKKYGGKNRNDKKYSDKK